LLIAVVSVVLASVMELERLWETTVIDEDPISYFHASCPRSLLKAFGFLRGSIRTIAAAFRQ